MAASKPPLAMSCWQTPGAGVAVGVRVLVAVGVSDGVSVAGRGGQRAGDDARQLSHRRERGARRTCDVVQIDTAQQIAGGVIPGIAIAHDGVVVEVLQRQERGVAVVPKGRVIGEAAGRALFQLQSQALTVALVRRNESVRQSDRGGAGAGMQLDGSIVITIPADHVEIDIAHNLCARYLEITGIDLAAPHPLLLAGEVDEADRVGEVQVVQDLGQGQRRRRAGCVIIGAGRGAVGDGRCAVQVAADQPDALRMDDASDIGGDVAPAVGAVCPREGARRQAEGGVVLPHVGLSIRDPGGEGVARGNRDGRAADERRPGAAQVGDQIVDARFADLTEQCLDRRIGHGRHGGGQRCYRTAGPITIASVLSKAIGTPAAGSSATSAASLACGAASRDCSGSP